MLHLFFYRELSKASDSDKSHGDQFKSSIFDTSKLDPLDIDGWKRLVEGAIEDKDYTITGSG